MTTEVTNETALETDLDLFAVRKQVDSKPEGIRAETMRKALGWDKARLRKALVKLLNDKVLVKTGNTRGAVYRFF